MAKGKYTRIARNVKLTFDVVTAARLTRAAERDESTVTEMLERWVCFNIETIDPIDAEGGADE